MPPPTIGEIIFRHACHLGWEGIVSRSLAGLDQGKEPKRASSAQGGRGRLGALSQATPAGGGLGIGGGAPILVFGLRGIGAPTARVAELGGYRAGNLSTCRAGCRSLGAGYASILRNVSTDPYSGKHGSGVSNETSWTITTYGVSQATTSRLEA